MIKRIFTLVFISIVSFSCTTDIEPLDPSLVPVAGGNNGSGNNTNAIFTADIDGVFTNYSSSVMAEQSQDGLSIGRATNPTLALQIFNPAVGTFNIDAANTNTGALIFYSVSQNSLYFPSSGSVVITSYDTTTMMVSGTFNGVLEDVAGVDPDVLITNGVFQNITYTEVMTTDMGSATVNGNSFVANFFASVEVNTSLGVTFSNSTNEQIGLSFPIDIAVGTYPIDSFPGGVYTGTYSSDTVNNGATHNSVTGSGNLVITDRTNDILTGTFNFTAVDPADSSSSFIITNGNFVYEIN